MSTTTRASIASEVRPGLEGVVAFETELSDVDGERGRLIVRGHDVEALAARATFEDVLALLLDGALPDARRREALRAALGAARVAAFAALDDLGDALARGDGMDALRAALAHRASEGDERDALGAVGALAVYAAAWAARRSGRAPLVPDARASHAADTLRMVRGAPATAAEVRALDAYLVTVADHGMNASTFTARVVASTGSDLVSALVAALGALKGPLHGGAPGPVLDMLDAIGAPERAESWLEAELAAGHRIMGMGHRIYRVRDPRAAVLESALLALERARAEADSTAAPGGGGRLALARARAGADSIAAPGGGDRLALARAVEAAAEGVLARRHPERRLRANVEFYTAVLLDALGIPRALFTPTFAVGRAAGWSAHVLEERRTGRLVRPASRYVGAVPEADAILPA